MTALFWFGIGLLSTGGRFDELWHHLGQVVRFDEEFMIFSCFLLFSIAMAVHILAIAWRTSYRSRFLFPQLGIVYSITALILGNTLRQPMHDPIETWFQIIYPLLVICGFVAIFGRRYVCILTQQQND